MIEDMNFFLFIKLLKAFNFLTNIFEFSKNKMLFRDILIQNHFYIENKVFKDMTNENLKQKALAVYKNLKKQGFSFVSVFSSLFPESLKEYPETPLLLFVKGNKEILNDNKTKKVYLYASNMEYIKSNRTIYEMLKHTVLKENIITLTHKKEQEEFIEKIKFSLDKENETYQKQIVFKIEDIFDLNYSMNSQMKLYANKNIEENMSDKKEHKLNKENVLYIYIPKTTNSFKYKELVSASIAQKLFVLNASFQKDIQELTSIFLDMGKEIIAIPGNVSDPMFSFSNYLLRDGANMVLNKKDIDVIFR